ncbi:MAG: AAA family ATPase, partial [Methanobacterium sp.]
MILNTIKIKNFRQYQQEEIEIAGSKDEKNFTIIQGMNGAGKSNFLNAMTWCLYGEEHHKVAKYEGLPLLNTVTHNDLEVGEICEVKVEMKMCDNENLMFFSRKIEFKKLKNGDVKVLRYPESGDDGSIFEICKLNGDDW